MIARRGQGDRRAGNKSVGQDNCDREVGTGQPGQDSRRAQSGQDSLDRKERSGQPENTLPMDRTPGKDNNQYRTARTGKQGKDSQDKTAIREQPGHGSQNRTARTGKNGQNTAASIEV
jgi:hypothetical protein